VTVRSLVSLGANSAVFLFVCTRALLTAPTSSISHESSIHQRQKLWIMSMREPVQLPRGLTARTQPLSPPAPVLHLAFVLSLARRPVGQKAIAMLQRRSSERVPTRFDKVRPAHKRARPSCTCIPSTAHEEKKFCRKSGLRDGEPFCHRAAARNSENFAWPGGRRAYHYSIVGTV
jgi:hypothetical protein